MTEEEKDAYIKKLVQSNIDQQNKVALLSAKVYKLQKENTELKDEIKNDRDIPAIAYMQGAEKQKKKDEEQLTKAIEIIREFVEWANWQGNSKCPSFKSIQDTAEQFLKGQEEEPCGQ